MLLDRIISLIPDGNRRFPLKYVRMLNSIRDRYCLAKNKYLLAHPIRTPAVEMIRNILLNLDINALDGYKTDVDRYTEYIKFTGQNARVIFDPNFTNSISEGKFLDNQPVLFTTPHRPEIYLNCEFVEPLKELPFNAGWDEWQDLRGIRMTYNDSLSLPEDFSNSRLSYFHGFGTPRYIVMAINVPLLCFKYYKYVCDCREDGQQPDVNYFIKQFEFSHFFEDLVDIFVLNLIMRVFSDPDGSVDSIVRDTLIPRRFVTDNMLRQGVECIKEYVDLLRSGAIKPQDFLAIHWFGDRSLMEVIHDNCYRWVALPETSRYLWLRTLHEFPYFEVLVACVRLFIDGPLKNTLETRCKEIWTLRIKPINMTGSVTSPYLKELTAEMKSHLEAFLNGEKQPLPRKYTNTR